MIKAVAIILSLGMAVPGLALAGQVSNGVGQILTAPTRNAMPSDQEEMNQRELCARRNLANNGTVYGNCAAAPMQPAGHHCPGFNSMTQYQCVNILHKGYDAANCTCVGK